MVPGATTVLFDGVADLDGLRALLAGWTPDDAALDDGPLVEVAGDLRRRGPGRRRRALGHRPAGVAARLAGTELVSAFCGFAPGFAYLSGLPAELAVPRLDTPRPAVPAGSVAVADRWCGIYPSASPGGWRLLGHRPARRSGTPTSDSPALLAPGTRVRLVPA